MANLEDIPTKQTFAKFVEKTDAHGFIKISKTRGWKRILWVVIVSMAYLGFFGHLGLLCSDFLEYRTSTKVTTEQHSFEFPDVTFCPTTPFYNMDSFFRKYSLKLVKYYNIWNFIRKTDPDLAEIDGYYHYMPALRYIQEGEKATRWPHDQIIDCLYKNKKCDFRNFSRIRDPKYLGCFKFHPNDPELMFEGNKGGLQLTLSTLGSRRLFLFAHGTIDQLHHGYTVHIHARNTRPNFETSQIHVQTGMKFEIGVDMETDVYYDSPQHTCLHSVEDLRLAWKEGVLESFTYTDKTCKEMHEQERIFQDCHCLDESLVVPAVLTKRHNFCHQINESLLKAFSRQEDNNLILTYMNSSRIQETSLCNYRSMQRYHRVHSKQHIKRCPITCKKTSYKHSINSYKWPYMRRASEYVFVQKIKDLINITRSLGLGVPSLLGDYKGFENRSRWQENDGNYPFVAISIVANSLITMVRTEDLLVPFPNLLANIGGIMGLWLGISIITLFEFTELCGALIRIKVYRPAP